MSGRSLRRTVAAGVLMTVLSLLPVVAEAAPAAARVAAPDLWARAWEWVASWWEGPAAAPGRLSGEKQGGTSDPSGTPLLTPGGTTSTATSGTGGTGEVGAGTDPDG